MMFQIIETRDLSIHSKEYFHSRKREFPNKKLRNLRNLILTATTSADKPQIVEFGHLIFHDGRAVSQLAAPILIVAGPNRDNRSIANGGQCDHFECNW